MLEYRFSPDNGELDDYDDDSLNVDDDIGDYGDEDDDEIVVVRETLLVVDIPVVLVDSAPEAEEPPPARIPVQKAPAAAKKTAYEMTFRDWSSDVCSSDLARDNKGPRLGNGASGKIQ